MNYYQIKDEIGRVSMCVLSPSPLKPTLREGSIKRLSLPCQLIFDIELLNLRRIHKRNYLRVMYLLWNVILGGHR